ncbi:MAG: YIP1 family protein [Bacteroidales bacterium]|nr:YIP1 family protein [Bacteroidales bacterium]
MNLNLLYRRIRDIIVNPTAMWQSVREEGREVNELRISFLLPLSLLVSLAGLTGMLIFTYHGLSIIFPLTVALKYFISCLAAVEITALIVTEIAPLFTGRRSFSENYKLVLYSIAPFMAAMIITRLFPALIFLNLAGLYGIFIAWKGTDIFSGVPASLRTRYTLVIFFATITVYFSLAWLLSAVLDGLFYSVA